VGKGTLWISDVAGDKIDAVSPAGQVELLIDTAGGCKDPPPGEYFGPNAMVTDKEGAAIPAQQGGRNVVRTECQLDGPLKVVPFLDTCGGKKFNSPNDLIFAPTARRGSPVRRMGLPVATRIRPEKLLS
jgi:gluconolactonase